MKQKSKVTSQKSAAPEPPLAYRDWREAWQRGWVVGRDPDGQLDANPYPRRTVARTAWAHGWITAGEIYL